MYLLRCAKYLYTTPINMVLQKQLCTTGRFSGDLRHDGFICKYIGTHFRLHPADPPLKISKLVFSDCNYLLYYYRLTDNTYGHLELRKRKPKELL